MLKTWANLGPYVVGGLFGAALIEALPAYAAAVLALAACIAVLAAALYSDD